MKKATQLYITLRNRPGSLAHLSQLFFQAGINVQAIMATGSGPKMIVDNTQKAISILEKNKIPFTTDEVLVFELTNKPGQIAQIAKKIAEAGINIDYIYGTANPDQPKGYFIIEVAEIDKVLKLELGV
jgi:hypothetical protein